MIKISEERLTRKPQGVQRRGATELRQEVRTTMESVISFAEEQAATTLEFKYAEAALQRHLRAVGRAVLSLYLEIAEARIAATLEAGVSRMGRQFRRAPALCRGLLTVFGVIWYWRSYLRETTAASGSRHGYHPLDAQLGLTADRVSHNVLATSVRLATRMSFAEAHEVARWFLPTVPSTEVIQNAVQGLGEDAARWFHDAPLPEGDGDVLVIQIDSKGAPTATEEELRKRRGPRKTRIKSPSPRHRGRALRDSWTRKPRRKKGDKSKNAKMATLVVMYTLRRERGLLLGPINKRFYASFAPKRHAVEYAQREAARRGFGPARKKDIQVVTDGDNDLRHYVAELFPGVRHTLDLLHVVERIWTAGECLYDEGTAELRDWAVAQREQLLLGNTDEVLAEMERRLAAIPKTGPGNKGKRQRLAEALGYLRKRAHQMHYREVMAKDLEMGTGAVEGAVKNLIGKRMDHGGMRWIKERAEAVLKLRCIDANGQWEAFMQRVHHRLRDEATAHGSRPRLQRRQPAILPSLLEAA